MEQDPEALAWRYAVKKFDPTRQLADNLLNRLMEAFNLTATSYGLQPIRMLVVRHPELQEQLVAHSYGQRQVADASHVLVLCVETKIDAAFIKDYFERVKELRGTSERILEPFRESLLKRFAGMDQAEIRAWAINQAYLALGNLLTVCAYERIDSCPMEGFVPGGYDQVLGLGEQGLEAVLVLPVGYRAPDDMFATLKKVRRPLERSVQTIEKKVN